MNVLLERDGQVFFNHLLPVKSLRWACILTIIKNLQPNEVLKIYDFGNYLLEVTKDA